MFKCLHLNVINILPKHSDIHTYNIYRNKNNFLGPKYNVKKSKISIIFKSTALKFVKGCQLIFVHRIFRGSTTSDCSDLITNVFFNFCNMLYLSLMLPIMRHYSLDLTLKFLRSSYRFRLGPRVMMYNLFQKFIFVCNLSSNYFVLY